MDIANPTIDKIKTILKIKDNDEDRLRLIEVLLENAIATIRLYINIQGNDIFPDSLEFIVVELTVARYRKIGAEGISTEKIDDLSTTYSLNDLSRYKDLLDMYKDNNGKSGKKLKTL